MRMNRLFFSVLMATLAMLFSVQLDAAEFKLKKGMKKPEPAVNVLDMKCTDCHAVIRDVTPQPDQRHGQCETCHTGREKHITSVINEGIGKGTMGKPGTQECLVCHKDQKKLLNWSFAEHNKAGLACSDCHEIHVSPLIKKSSVAAPKMDRNSAACVRCHEDVNARLNMTSHHPVKEGALSCISCHDQHGSTKTVLQTKSAQCLTCHQALRGPHVFEHAPVVEDCMNCHTPHGSSNRRLLTVSQPASCLQCHSIAQGKHGYGTGLEPDLTSGTKVISGAVLRNCTNCHGSIHGSHQDPLLRN